MRDRNQDSKTLDGLRRVLHENLDPEPPAWTREVPGPVRRPARGLVWVGASAAALAIIVVPTVMWQTGDTGPTGSSTTSPTTSVQPSTPATPSTDIEPATPTPPDAVCQPFGPRRLPSGSPIGQPADLGKNPGGASVSWGTGQDAVFQRPGEDVLGLAAMKNATTVTSDRLGEVRLIAVGDPPLGQIAAFFRVDGCAYTVWLDGSMADAADEYFRNLY